MATAQEEIDEFKRYEFLAENGHPTFQYFLSAAINAIDNYPERQVQSLKWALLAHYFEEPQAVDVIMFVQHRSANSSRLSLARLSSRIRYSMAALELPNLCVCSVSRKRRPNQIA